MDLLAQWQTARINLEKATQVFYDASIKLKPLIPEYTCYSDQRIAFNKAFSSHIPALELTHKKLAELRPIVDQMFNMSMPVCTLPDEILATIFDLALVTSSSSDHPWYSQPNLLLNITSVCAQWRRVATQTRPLWSHIYLKLPSAGGSVSLNLVELWLARSQGSSIHIHVPRRFFAEQSYMKEFVSLLRPHSRYITSVISLREEGDSGLFLYILDLCAELGEQSPVKTLVWFGEQHLTRRPSVLRRLTGLVNLELGWLTTSQCPTVDQLATVLTRNQSIRTLRLSNVRFPEGNSSTISSIELPSLQLLDLAGLDEPTARWLLGVLSPGKGKLDLRISLFDTADFDLVVAQFLGRSYIVSLWLYDASSRGVPISPRLPVLPSVRVLGLVSQQEGIGIISALVIGQGDNLVPRFPNLHSLHFRASGTVNRSGWTKFHSFVGLYSLSVLYLDHCNLIHDPAESDSDSEQAKLSAQLRPHVGRVVFNNISLDKMVVLDMYVRGLVEDSRVS